METKVVQAGQNLLRWTFGQDRDLDFDGSTDQEYLGYALSNLDAKLRNELAIWFEAQADRPEAHIREALQTILRSELDPNHWEDLDGGPGKGPAAMVRYLARSLREEM